jgi:malate dehydrogenase (oxaloacetate-decarboxylating)(NADP+)
MEQINLKSTAIDKYSYLSNLRNTNAGLFYRLLIDHMKVRITGWSLGCSEY